MYFLSSSSYMDVDRSSLAAAALYDMKNEQLQLANAALQQQVAAGHSQQTPSTDHKQQESSVSTTTDQSIATTTEGQQFGVGGGTRKQKKNRFFLSLYFNLRNGTRNSIRNRSIFII